MNKKRQRSDSSLSLENKINTDMDLSKAKKIQQIEHSINSEEFNFHFSTNDTGKMGKETEHFKFSCNFNKESVEATMTVNLKNLITIEELSNWINPVLIQEPKTKPTVVNIDNNDNNNIQEIQPQSNIFSKGTTSNYYIHDNVNDNDNNQQIIPDTNYQLPLYKNINVPQNKSIFVFVPLAISGVGKTFLDELLRYILQENFTGIKYRSISNNKIRRKVMDRILIEDKAKILNESIAYERSNPFTNDIFENKLKFIKYKFNDTDKGIIYVDKIHTTDGLKRTFSSLLLNNKRLDLKFVAVLPYSYEFKFLDFKKNKCTIPFSLSCFVQLYKRIRARTCNHILKGDNPNLNKILMNLVKQFIDFDPKSLLIQNSQGIYFDKILKLPFTDETKEESEELKQKFEVFLALIKHNNYEQVKPRVDGFFAEIDQIDEDNYLPTKYECRTFLINSVKKLFSLSKPLGNFTQLVCEIDNKKEFIKNLVIPLLEESEFYANNNHQLDVILNNNNIKNDMNNLDKIKKEDKPIYMVTLESEDRIYYNDDIMYPSCYHSFEEDKYLDINIQDVVYLPNKFIVCRVSNIRSYYSNTLIVIPLVRKIEVDLYEIMKHVDVYKGNDELHGYYNRNIFYFHHRDIKMQNRYGAIMKKIK